MKVITFDTEIAKDVMECGGWDFTDRFGISTAVAYRHHTDDILIVDDKTTDALRKEIAEADIVCGFNNIDFDYPVLYGLKKGSKPDKGVWVDLLQMIWRALGKREKGWKLGQIAKNSIGHDKNDDGGLAPNMYKNGEWGRLINYCVNDVILTVKMIKFAAINGYVYGEGKRMLMLDWKPYPTFVRNAIIGKKVEVTSDPF